MNLYQPTEENKVNNTIHKTAFDDVFFVPHSYNPDDRGFFKEIAKIPELEEVLGSTFSIKQINHARSVSHVVRGFHAENWNKLITIANGECLCVLADIRPDSSTFGQVEYFQIGAGEQVLQGSIFIPKGVANSVCVESGPVDYLYMVDMLYKDRDTNGDVAISLFDPDLNVEWPLPKEEMIISQRDLQSITLREKFAHKF